MSIANGGLDALVAIGQLSPLRELLIQPETHLTGPNLSNTIPFEIAP